MLETVKHRSGRYAVKPGAGILLRQARVRAGIKQYRLGMQLGCTSQRAAQALVHRIENREQGPIEHVMNAAALLGVPLEAVIEFVPAAESA